MSVGTQVIELSNFINGQWVPAADGATFDIINPANGQLSAKAASSSVVEVNEAVKTARTAFESGVWSGKSVKERAEILNRFAGKIQERSEEIVYLEGISSGGTIRKIAGADIAQICFVLAETAKLATEFDMMETLPVVDFVGASKNEIIKEPLGVVAAVTPWNFPLLLAMWKIAPALAMGNSIIVKPASNTPLGTLKLAEIALEAGIPAGVFNVITGPGGLVGEALVSHPEVDKVSFTGSTEVGRKIMSLSAETVKKVTLELGGKSPSIVLPDVDYDIAIPGIIYGAFFHAGQVCESGTRLLVHEDIYEEVLEKLAKQAAKIQIGNPFDPTTGMGPVVSKHQMNTVLSYIQSGLDEGARLVCGGKRLEGPGFDEGYFIAPTIFADVTNDMKIAREEIFGPVLSVIKYSTIEEAIEIANDTIYGLAGGVWTRDLKKAHYIAGKLKAGTIWINDWHAFRNDAPFGGYKQSGNGRELGRRVFDEYTETKHIHVSLTNEPSLRLGPTLLF